MAAASIERLKAVRVAVTKATPNPKCCSCVALTHPSDSRIRYSVISAAEKLVITRELSHVTDTITTSKCNHCPELQATRHSEG